MKDQRIKISNAVFNSPVATSKRAETQQIESILTLRMNSYTISRDDLCLESPLCNLFHKECTSCSIVRSNKFLQINKDDFEIGTLLLTPDTNEVRVSAWNICSPHVRCSRTRTVEFNHTMEISTPKLKPETTPSGIIASAERMKQNTDSMVEDAVISQKLK